MNPRKKMLNNFCAVVLMTLSLGNEGYGRIFDHHGRGCSHRPTTLQGDESIQNALSGTRSTRPPPQRCIFGHMYVPGPLIDYHPKNLRGRVGSGVANNHYGVMTDKQLMAMGEEIKLITTKDSALFMWCSGPTFNRALKLITAWGFTYKMITPRSTPTPPGVPSRRPQCLRGRERELRTHRRLAFVGWRQPRKPPRVASKGRTERTTEVPSQAERWPS
jgi:hypothetical protein